MPHDVPLHVAVPFDGTGHAEHDVGPHDAVDELPEQTPLHSCVLAGQAHRPPWHVFPPEHANWVPHPPQLLASVCRSTQALAHEVNPVLQTKVQLLP
jgi:hypothetical protein